MKLHFGSIRIDSFIILLSFNYSHLTIVWWIAWVINIWTRIWIWMRSHTLWTLRRILLSIAHFNLILLLWFCTLTVFIVFLIIAIRRLRWAAAFLRASMIVFLFAYLRLFLLLRRSIFSWRRLIIWWMAIMFFLTFVLRTIKVLLWLANFDNGCFLC